MDCLGIPYRAVLDEFVIIPLFPVPKTIMRPTAQFLGEDPDKSQKNDSEFLPRSKGESGR
jgi:hypothetical protein